MDITILPIGGLTGAQAASQNPNRLVGHTDFSQSPCSTCGGAPCCRHLPLASLRVDTREDLQCVADLASFQNIIPALREDGNWWLFYRMDCGFLQPDTGMCSIHNSPDQPRICKTYSPYSCWYRNAFQGFSSREPSQDQDDPEAHSYLGANASLIQFSRQRVVWLMEAISYTGNRDEIDQVPGWDQILQACVTIPLDTKHPNPKGIVHEKQPSQAQLPLDSTAGDLPAMLIVPPGKPSKPAHLDLIRFRLGYPQIRFVGTGETWTFTLPLRLQPGLDEGTGVAILERLHSGLLDQIIENLDGLSRNLLFNPQSQVISLANLHLLDTLFPEPNPQDPETRQPA